MVHHGTALPMSDTINTSRRKTHTIYHNDAV